MSKFYINFNLLFIYLFIWGVKFLPKCPPKKLGLRPLQNNSYEDLAKFDYILAIKYIFLKLTFDVYGYIVKTNYKNMMIFTPFLFIFSVTYMIGTFQNHFIFGIFWIFYFTFWQIFTRLKNGSQWFFFGFRNHNCLQMGVKQSIIIEPKQILEHC